MSEVTWSPSLKRKRTNTDAQSTTQTNASTVKKSRGIRFRESTNAPEDDDIQDDDEDTQRERTSDSSSDDEDDDDDDMKVTTMAITCYQGRIGAAYFDRSQLVLHLLEDTQDSLHFDLTTMMFEQIKPDVILTSSRADERLIRQCQLYMDENAGRFQVRPHREFTANQGKERLLSLRILNHSDYDDYTDIADDASVSRNAYDFMRGRQNAPTDPVLAKWRATLRAQNYSAMTAPLCLSATGALLDHLVRENAANDLEGEGIGGLDVSDVKLMELEHSMLINADALNSLQIFANEGHASMHSDRTKEGLSLFGILDHTRTPAGRSLLRQWLLRPSLDLATITSRHDALSCFLLGENLPVVDALQKHLKGLKNTPRVLSALRTGRAGIRDWTALIKFTFHIVMLRESLGEMSSAGDIDIVEKIHSTFEMQGFKEMGMVVNDTIDWESSMNEGRVCVRYNIDPELDEKKRVYDGLSIFLAQVAMRVGDGLEPEYTENLNVIYFPQLGYLISVPLRDEWRGLQEFPVADGWVFQFSTDEQLYFKNQDMHDLDRHIGDLKSIIIDREIELIHELQEKVLEYDEAIKSACDTCAELDCLLSLTTASRLYDFARPCMVSENVLEIHKGRHPLQELCEDAFVPNDFLVHGGQGTGTHTEEDNDERDVDQDAAFSGKPRSVLICTGPNACGKSVYLKQNALIPIMAQIGCFVPARAATLGVVDKVFTRIQTRESVGKAQSAFMIDLAQVSLAVRNCTERSLIILDEFGKGTMASVLVEDGAGLLCGLIRHLLSRGTACPKVVVATHFHEIFRNQLLDASLPITLTHMQVVAHSSGALVERDMDTSMPGEDQFTFLFDIAPGLLLDSFATYCAVLNGIPEPIARRAKHVSELLAKNDVTTLLDEQLGETEIAEIDEAEAITRRFCGLDLGSSEDLKERLRSVLGRESA